MTLQTWSGSSADAQSEELPRILVVDDRPANLTAMVEILKAQDYAVVTASSGSEALRILMRQDFAVILLDVHMPGVGGFEVAKLLRSRERSEHTPIIFVTAVGVGDESVTQGYSLGAVDYLFTPVIPEILRAKIAVFVDLYVKTRQLGAASRLEALLREKETLLREIHHRVKNNLQLVSSLINLHIQKIKKSTSRTALEECRDRVKAIALVHEKLYQSKDHSRVAFSDYTRTLARNVFDATGVSPATVSLELAIDDVALPVDKALPCGLILNELITNALKHGFRDGRRGVIRVELGLVDGRLRLLVKDNGIGMREGLDVQEPQSLGLRLVRTLARQLDAEIEVHRGDGTSFHVSFPAAS